MPSGRTADTPPSSRAGRCTQRRLGKEIGFYQDPYSDYGRLENEMWRAIRLVVDTGVHEKHWSRDQMVDYFPSLHRDGRAECAERSGPLHRMAGTGTGLQAGAVGNSEIARRGASETGRQVRLARLSRSRWSAAVRFRWASCTPRLKVGSARRKRTPNPSQSQAILRLGLAVRGAEESSTRLRPDCLARYKA